jgi:hypothetical protein
LLLLGIEKLEVLTTQLERLGDLSVEGPVDFRPAVRAREDELLKTSRDGDTEHQRVAAAEAPDE